MWPVLLHVDIYLWPMLPSKAMLRSMVHAAAKGHADVHVCVASKAHESNPGQKPCGSLRFMSHLTLKGKEASVAVLSMTADSVENERYRRLFYDLFPLPHPPKKTVIEKVTEEDS